MTLFCINLFSGPSSGKSVFSADLFSALKKKHYSVEQANEVAKDRILQGREHSLKNQIAILGAQWERISQLDGQFNIAVTDSPVLFCSVYAPAHYPQAHHDLAWWCHRHYPRINFFVQRQDGLFESAGRVHDQAQSLLIDEEIMSMLKNGGEEFIILPPGEERLEIAMKAIEERFINKD